MPRHDLEIGSCYDISGLRRAAINSAPIKTISEYLEVATQFISERSKFDSRCRTAVVWARGVPDARYCLNPSLLRRAEPWIDDHEKPDADGQERYLQEVLEIEAELRALFRTRAISRGGNEPFREHAIDLASAMQHHGAPTRFLDWSGNPLIALYFALDAYFEHEERAPETKRHPGVWLLRPRYLMGLIDDRPRILTKWDKEAEETLGWLGEGNGVHSKRDKVAKGGHDVPPVPMMPSHVTARITAQQGRFTLHGFSLDRIEWEWRKKNEPQWLSLRLISPSHARNIYSQLRDIGVHEYAAFPNLDGLGRYSSRLMRERMLQQQPNSSPPGIALCQ